MLRCLKLQVSFHKRATNYRALLRDNSWFFCGKSPIKIRHLLGLCRPVFTALNAEVNWQRTPFIRVTWYVCVYGMTRSYITCAMTCCLYEMTWLVNMCDMTRWYVWLDSFICATSLVNMCDMTRWYVWHDSLVCVTWLVIFVKWLVHMSHNTHGLHLVDCYTRQGTGQQALWGGYCQ